MAIKDLNILKSFNILYIEDDENLLLHTKDVLEDFVNKIYAVKTTKEALDILFNKKVDVIISDILLKNENGIEFLNYLKNEKKLTIPAILTTAHTDTKYLLDAIKLKVENYIVKPISIKELLDTLHDVLLPVVQKKEIQKNNNIIKIIGAVTDSKQVDVIKYIINNLNNDNEINTSYSEIMEIINISKPTLIKLFKELASKGILSKIQHKTYRFDEQSLKKL